MLDNVMALLPTKALREFFSIQRIERLSFQGRAS